MYKKAHVTRLWEHLSFTNSLNVSRGYLLRIDTLHLRTIHTNATNQWYSGASWCFTSSPVCFGYQAASKRSSTIFLALRTSRLSPEPRRDKSPKNNGSLRFHEVSLPMLQPGWVWVSKEKYRLRLSPLIRNRINSSFGACLNLNSFGVFGGRGRKRPWDFVERIKSKDSKDVVLDTKPVYESTLVEVLFF